MIGRLDRGLLLWLAVIAASLAMVFLREDVSWLQSYPEALVLPLVPTMNAAMQDFITDFGFIFKGISWLMDWPFAWVRGLLHWLPWPVTMALVVVVAHAARGWKLALFAFLSLLYMLVTGYWDMTMNSLTLVALSVPLAVAMGFVFGVWGFYSRRAERVIQPTLDLMQTVPAFAYLIPILLLFGFGPVVGLIASLLYAFPPMVRNTILGLRGVSAEVIESGIMSGATPAQLFWQVRLPSARRQVLLGVNQTTMASLSMVIVASIIGGTEDIGWEVLSTMRKALFGESLLAGLVIALIAMVLDRITWGLAMRDGDSLAEVHPSWFRRHPHWTWAIGLSILFFALAQLVPAVDNWPETWTFSVAQYLNDAVTYVVVNHRDIIEGIKTVAFFYIILPTKIGLEQAVSPYSWGFELQGWHQWAYLALVLVLAQTALKLWGGRAAVTVGLFGLIFYAGLTNIPWPALSLIFLVLAWRLGGWTLALGTGLGLAFLAVTGSWEVAVRSLHLCGLAVLVSFLVGGAIGIWAAHSDRVSAIVRPINDTLQTMPLFVLLIPVVMIFKIGEFTALIAITAYAIVPSIRYVEHGLRSLPEDILEAATAMGTTGAQKLFLVKLPLAMPVIMLGLNQTIMYGIAMLVIAALVGTDELGQQVYIGLGDADFGIGMIAGIGMAIIAMVADRMTQAFSRLERAETGTA